MIYYVTGDATDPPPLPGPRFIAHICNDIGAWGAGFTAAISQKWSSPERAFRLASASSHGLPLGEIQIVPTSVYDLLVVNMVAQHGIYPISESLPRPPIRYAALRLALSKLAPIVAGTGGSVHMPRIGCGLAGGNWAQVETIVSSYLESVEYVYVYDLPQ